MPLDSGWEIVGYGTPTPNLSASQIFSGEDPGWHNVEKGADYPTDDDIASSTDAVVRDPRGHYHTVSLMWFDELWELEEYVDDVMDEEYG